MHRGISPRRSPAHPSARVLAGAVLGALLAGAVGCGDDSEPFTPTSAAPSDAATATVIIDNWNVLPTPMPTPRRGLVTATVSGSIYAIGGKGANDAELATVERFTPSATTKWTARAPLPSPRAWPSGAVVINGKIYVAGGYNADSVATKTLYVYDPAANSWVSKAPMPIATAAGAAVAISGKLYVLTPTSTGVAVHRYDPASNTWTAKAKGPVHFYPVAGVIGGKIYVAGTTKADKTALFDTNMYDPATNSWSPETAKNYLMIGGSGRVLDDMLYTYGGSHEWLDVTHGGTEVYNPAAETWYSMPDMFVTRTFLSAAVIGRTLYAIGGWNEDTGALGTVEKYPLP